MLDLGNVTHCLLAASAVGGAGCWGRVPTWAQPITGTVTLHSVTESALACFTGSAGAQASLRTHGWQQPEFLAVGAIWVALSMAFRQKAWTSSPSSAHQCSPERE